MIRRALSLASTVLLAAACNRDAGGFVRPEQPPMRIVAGSVLAAEVLLEIAPRERIAAVHYVAADPAWSLVAAEAKTLRQVGAEPEALLSVRPDLVIVDAFTKPETLAILRSAGVPVLRTAAPVSFADIAANLRLIGGACHLEAEAAALARRMEQRLDDLARRGHDLGGWSLLSLDGALHTLGRGSLFDAIVDAAGARNLAAEHGVGPFRKLTLESVLAWHPEVLVIDVASAGEAAERAWIAQLHGLGLVPAVREDRLLFVPSAQFGTTSHRLVDAVEFLQGELLRRGPR